MTDDKRNAEGHRTFKVDYVYDTEWDCTYPWSERAELVEDRDDPTKPLMVKSLIQGPDLWVVQKRCRVARTARSATNIGKTPAKP